MQRNLRTHLKTILWPISVGPLHFADFLEIQQVDIATKIGVTPRTDTKVILELENVQDIEELAREL